MDNLKINDNIIITGVEQVIKNLERCVGFEVKIEDIIAHIETNKNVFFYIDNKLNSSMCEQADSLYVWIDTGLKNGKKPIFISLVRKQNVYEGYYVGDAERLAESMVAFNPIHRKNIYVNLPRFKDKFNKKQESHVNGVIKETVRTSNVIFRFVKSENDKKDEKDSVDKKEKIRDLYTEIFNSLLINNWKSIKGLERFIKIIGCRVEQLIDAKKDEYYILNNIKSVVVKTGLLDKFATDILVLYKWNVKYNGYVAEKMIKSKKELVEEGFKKSEIQKNIKTITFFDGDEVLKGVRMEDFDLNSECLKHILEDRKDRFPQEFSGFTTDFFAGKLRESLAMGLKILEHDIHYAKPSYSAKTKSITWFMPLYVYRSLSEKPELVLAIRMDSEQIYYEVKTVLPYNDEIMDRITALSLYGTSW